MRLGKRHLSVFLKMLITFLLVITPLYFLNLYLNVSSRESVRREIKGSTMAKADFFMDGIDKEFNGIMLMQQSLMNDTDLVQISGDNIFLQQYERNRALLSIQKRLAALKDTSRYVVDVSISVPLIGKKITSRSISDLKENEAEEMERVARSGYYPFYINGDSIFIDLAPADRIVINGQIRQGFVISIEISKTLLEETLRDMSSAYAGSGAALLSNGNGIEADSSGKREHSAQLRALLAGRPGATGEAAATSLKMDGRNYIVVYKTSRMLDTTLAAYIPEDRLFGTLTLYTVWIWVVTLTTAAVIALFALRVQRVVTRPLGRLIGAFGRLDEGNADISVSYQSNDEFGYLYSHFNDMVKRFGDLIRQVYEEKLRTKDAELKQLQYQINPHFLYNTVYILYRMARSGDLDGITQLTLHLGDYYKFVSGNFNEAVPLEKEWAHARDYVGIQSFRFSRRITVEFSELPEGAADIPVPRLILQPIIENAYKHGLKDREEGGLLRIRFELDGPVFHAFVEDNGDLVTPATIDRMNRLLSGESEGTAGAGMLNVHRRLQIRYGGESGLRLSVGGLGGLCVELRIELGEEGSRV